MSTPSGYDITGIDLSDDRYTVVQALIRNKYKATDSTGNVVLRGKQTMFKMKEEFPFVDGNGNDVFIVKAAGFLDVAGNYVLSDAQTGEEVVVLDNDFSILQDTWRLRDPETGDVLARIDSRGAAVTLARKLLPLGYLIPHKYEISAPDGTHIGSIAGTFSLKDTYVVTLDNAGEGPREPILAAAMVIDAIQGN